MRTCYLSVCVPESQATHSASQSLSAPAVEGGIAPPGIYSPRTALISLYFARNENTLQYSVFPVFPQHFPTSTHAFHSAGDVPARPLSPCDPRRAEPPASLRAQGCREHTRKWAEKTLCARALNSRRLASWARLAGFSASDSRRRRGGTLAVFAVDG